MTLRKRFLAAFSTAVDTVEGRRSVARTLGCGWYQPRSDAIHVVAIGKAAESMMLGALDVLAERIATGLVITKHHHVSAVFPDRIELLEASHPVPDQSSLIAGRALTGFVQNKREPLLFLISGGASSLVEVLQEGWDLESFQQLTEWMLGNGYSIHQMNSVRQAVSMIKAGGLWRFIASRQVSCLLISDVPGDTVSVIGSGLLFVPATRRPMPESLPEHWRQRIVTQPDPGTPNGFRYRIIASNTDACGAAAASLEQQGLTVRLHERFLQGDAVEAAKSCVAMICEQPGVVHIWGSETTVMLPENPGRGGRNQHLALAAAIEMQGMRDVLLLAAGTDGTDGMSDDAGALVDGNSIKRGELDGLDVLACLKQADSGRFLEASGDLISTGPTGTNVMDLVIAVSLGVEAQ